MVKSFLKKVPFVVNIYRRGNSWRLFRQVTDYHRNRFKKYAGAFHDSEESLLALIVMTYHVLEKGLTMPNRRFGFGQTVVHELISLLLRYEESYGRENEQYRVAVGVLVEYCKIHAETGYELNSDLSEKLTQFLSNHVNHPPTKQVEITRDKYYSEVDSDFEKFSWSRRSVRNFHGSVSVNQIKKAVGIANNAPSACNRQPCRVHLIENKDLLGKCIALQNGNRGFGHLVDKLIIVTSDVRPFLLSESNDVYLNGGLFAMNLSYALHSQRVAHCMLNWSVMPEVDMALRKQIPIPEWESVIMFIGCGDVPEKFSYAASCKKTENENFKVY